MLKTQFPQAAIRLTTAAWGGRNSDSFLAEPPGSQYNFESAVLAPHPDLIVMEFVNDSFMTPPVLEEKYASLQKRFAAIGAEWAILTPHFVRPDWMGASSARVEADPRPYVAGVRQFTAKHNVALADASLRWRHLLKEGIPYPTLFCNSINHPDDRGHEFLRPGAYGVVPLTRFPVTLRQVPLNRCSSPARCHRHRRSPAVVASHAFWLARASVR